MRVFGAVVKRTRPLPISPAYFRSILLSIRSAEFSWWSRLVLSLRLTLMHRVSETYIETGFG